MTYREKFNSNLRHGLDTVVARVAAEAPLAPGDLLLQRVDCGGDRGREVIGLVGLPYAAWRHDHQRTSNPTPYKRRRQLSTSVYSHQPVLCSLRRPGTKPTVHEAAFHAELDLASPASRPRARTPSSACFMRRASASPPTTAERCRSRVCTYGRLNIISCTKCTSDHRALR